MKVLAGVDEVGRGSLIGPVYAAAVILNKSINTKILKDSKSLSKNKRKEISTYIKKNSIWAILELIIFVSLAILIALLNWPNISCSPNT